MLAKVKEIMSTMFEVISTLLLVIVTIIVADTSWHYSLEPQVNAWKMARAEAKMTALFEAGDYEGAFCVAYPDHCDDGRVTDDWTTDPFHVSSPGTRPLYYLDR